MTDSGVERFCRHCGKPLVKGRPERQKNFEMRRFCNKSCAGKHATAVRFKRTAITLALPIDPLRKIDRE